MVSCVEARWRLSVSATAARPFSRKAAIPSAFNAAHMAMRWCCGWRPQWASAIQGCCKSSCSIWVSDTRLSSNLIMRSWRPSNRKPSSCGSIKSAVWRRSGDQGEEAQSAPSSFCPISTPSKGCHSWRSQREAITPVSVLP